MKKITLFMMALLVSVASMAEIVVEKVWENSTDVPTNAKNVGGHDGVLYCKNYSTGEIYAYSAEGRTILVNEGTASDYGFTTDEAGNIIHKTGSLGNGNPSTMNLYLKGSTVAIPITFEGMGGRTDFLTATGDFSSAEGGRVYFYPAGLTTVKYVEIKNANAETKTADVTVGELGTVAVAGTSTSAVYPMANGEVGFVRSTGLQSINGSVVPTLPNHTVATMGAAAMYIKNAAGETQEIWAYPTKGTVNYTATFNVYNTTASANVAAAEGTNYYIADSVLVSGQSLFMSRQKIDDYSYYLYIIAGYKAAACYKVYETEAPAKPANCSTVAEVKALEGENIPVTFTSSDAIITFTLNDGIIFQDATGAIKAQSYEWRYAEDVKAGLKLTSLSAYYNFNQTIDYGYWVQEENYPGVLYTPDTEPLTYTLGEEAEINYEVATADQLLADFEGYKYKAVKVENAAISMTEDGSYTVAATDTVLAIYYEGTLPAEATLLGYYGEHPYGAERGTCFNVMDIEVVETVLENAAIITEYDAENWSQTQSVMVGEEKLLVSYTGDDKLPRVAKVLKGYKASEVYYEYDENWNQIQMTRDVFVVTSMEVDNITISDFVATTEGSYKYVTYNEEKLRLQAPYGTTIPGMGTVTGYIYETASSSGTTLCFWVLEAEATGYSNINEYKNAVGAGNTATKSAAIADPMLVSYVYANPRLGTATLFVSQKAGYSTYYAAIRTTTTDKNGKAYAAGDSIKGVKGFLTAYGFDQTNNDIITGTYIDINPMENTIEIISSGATTPAATSLYDLAYLTGASKRSAGSYEARYMTISVGELKAKDVDGIAEYWFFSDKGDSILVVAPTFEITEDMLGRVGLKAFTDVKNSGANVQLILTAESDIVQSNVKFNSIAAIKAAGAAGAGITYELTTPVLVTYIQEDSELDWDTYVDVPKNWLYVQDATGAMRVSLDTAATRLSTVAVGDSIVGVKGVFDSYGAYVKVTPETAQHTVKNSNNTLEPKVITLKELIEAQSAGTYNAMLVRLENVEYIKSQVESEWTPGTFFDIHYFVQGEDTLSYSQGNFNDGFGAVGYTFYQVNNITAVVEQGWQGGQYGFWPVTKAAIESAVSTEEGATIISIREKTESKEVKFTGDATTSYITDRGIIIQDGTGAILLDGVDTLALDRKISNVEGTYYPSSADCMARIVPTSLEDKGRGRLSKETVTIDSLVNNIANFEGEIVDIAVAQTTRVSEGVYTMTTTDGATIAVRGAVVPSDAKLTGLIYHTSAEQGQAFTVTAYDFYNTGSNRVLMFHELKDYMAKWGPVTSEQYTISGFTSPVLVNSVFSSQGGTALNVQQTNADGSVTGLTIWAMETAEKFAAGDSIYFVKGGYVPFQDLSAIYGQEGYSRGRCIQAYRYDYHVGDIDYPADVDSIKNDDGEMMLPPIVEVQLGTLIKKLNSGNEFAYEKISDISGFFGATAVDYQAKNYEVTGTIVVDTTSYEWDGETVYEYATYVKVGENKLLVSGVDLKLFANQTVTLKGNFDIGYALEDRASFYISSLSNVDAGVALAANIAEFIELADTENEVLILGEVAVTYQNGANIYVRDNSGSLLIYDFDYQNAGYVNGDRLTGVKGKFKNYNGLPEMVDATLPAAVAGDAVAPRAISIADLATAGLSEYVVINEVKFAEALAFTAENRNATITNDAEETAALYNNFKLEASWGVQTPVSIVGTVGIYRENRQLNYISHEMFAVDFANINAIYRKGHWEASRYEDYSYGSVVARLNSQPTVVDMVQTAAMMGGTSNNYYLNDGTGVVVLQAPASGEDWMGNPVEGLELTVGQKLPEGLLANINFNALVNDTTYLPTGEVYGAPVLSFVQEVIGVDAEGWDTYRPYSEFAAGCVESDFVEDTVVVSLAEVLANRIDYAGKLLAVDTVGNYFAEVAMDHFTGTTSTSAYLFWDAEEAFDVEVYEEEGETYVYVSPKMTEDWYNYAGELFNLKAENLAAAALTDSATIALDVVRFDWNSIAQGQSLMLKGEYTIDNPNAGPSVDVENGELVVNVYANNGSVYVETEAGAMIEVYTVNGLRVYAGVSNTTTTVINGLSDIAIIRVNGQAYKVFVK